MSLDETVRKIANEVFDKRQQKEQCVPLADFLKEKNLSRWTIWRGEKEGRWKLIRIGRKVFINPNQFATK